MREYKSRKYTLIFSSVAICVFIFLSVLIGSYSTDPFVIESVTKFSKYTESYSSVLLFWRVSIYAALILAFYLYGMGHTERSNKGVVAWNTSRISAYLILFELVIVQNIFKLLYELIAG